MIAAILLLAALALPAGALATSGDASRRVGPIHIQGMELGSALRLLLEGSGASVVLDPDVSATVDLEVQEAAVADLMGLIAGMHGLVFEWRGSLLLVHRQATRTFTLDLIQIDGPAEEGSAQVNEWQEIRSNLDRMRSETGSVSIHERAGTITVRDTPHVLSLVEAYVEGIRSRLSQQVQIEARIVEVRLENSFESGIDWTALGGTLGGDWRGGLAGGSVSRQRTSTGEGVFQFGILRPGKVDLLIDAIAERSDVRVVARPRVVAGAARHARIEVTERVPYITKQVSREGGVAFTDFQVEFADAGVRLDVVAQPSEAGPIAMRIRPVVSSVTGYTPSLPDLGPQPIVDVRETLAQLMVRSSETVVISGLIQERKVTETRGVPILDRIPLLGYLFRHTAETTQRVELVVFLTPTLLDVDAADLSPAPE